MSEKKIVVPDGMLAAASDVTRKGAGYPHPDSRDSQRVVEITRCALEAALRWMSENPLVPQGQQMAEVRKLWDESISPTPPEYIAFVITAWQRRMFLAPEPEMIGAETVDEFCSRHKAIGPAVIEAYQRGLNAPK